MSESARQHQADSPPTLALRRRDDQRYADHRNRHRRPGDHQPARSSRAPVAAREIIRDEPDQVLRSLLAFALRDDIDTVLMTGGTGISQRDQTFETVSQLLTRPLPGYGEIFRWLSYQEIGPAAMLSRAVGGLLGRVVVLTMPGSPATVRAWRWKAHPAGIGTPGSRSPTLNPSTTALVPADSC